MSQTRESVVEDLKDNNIEFKRLCAEHEKLNKQLVELDQRRSLTAEDEMEIKRLKKIKLDGKDKMEEFIIEAIPAA